MRQSAGIVGGAVMVKVPQIRRIVSKRSVAGLRPQMFLAEVLGGAVAAAHLAAQGLALAAYAELYFILAQNLIILALIASFRSDSRDSDDAKGEGAGGDGPRKKSSTTPASTTTAVALVALFASLASGVFPPSALARMYEGTTAVLVAGRVPQIVANFRAKSTGELSPATQALMSLGSLARVFTTAQEGADARTVGAYAVSAGMNWVILAQMVWYGGGGGGGGRAGGGRGGKKKRA